MQRIKDGEEVDVKRLLGTGDEKSEREWEEVMKELEETDMLAEGRRKREQKRLEKARKREEAEEERKRGRDNVGAGQDSVARDDGKPKFLM